MSPPTGEIPPTKEIPPLSALAVLPARLGSTRLARKVLLDETGMPVFVHAAKNAATCSSIARVVVATDADEVRKAGETFGIEVVMTSPAHASGTDRVDEAVRIVGGTYDVVINVQADEPEIDPRDLDRLVAAFDDPEVEAATLAAPIVDEDELVESSVVKVVRGSNGDALYFSRAPIPHRSHAREGAPRAPLAMRHVGVYAFRPEALAAFCALAPSALETTESLEQLRWLEAGRSMRVLDAPKAPVGIDTRADYDAFVRRRRKSRDPSTSTLEANRPR